MTKSETFVLLVQTAAIVESIQPHFLPHFLGFCPRPTRY